MIFNRISVSSQFWKIVNINFFKRFFFNLLLFFLVLGVFESYCLFCRLFSLSNFLSSWLLSFILDNFFRLIFHPAILFSFSKSQFSTRSLVGIFPKWLLSCTSFPLSAPLCFVYSHFSVFSFLYSCLSIIFLEIVFFFLWSKHCLKMIVSLPSSFSRVSL